MTQDEMIDIEDAISELLAWGSEDRYRRVSCNTAVTALREKLAALSTPAPVAAPPADLVVVVREWQSAHLQTPVPPINMIENPERTRYRRARVERMDAARDALLAFPLPEVPK